MQTLLVSLAADQYRSASSSADATAELWCGNKGPHVVSVKADGAGQAQAFAWVDDFGPSPTLTVYFKNDAWGGDTAHDRNLYLLGATLDGVYSAPPAANKMASTGDLVRINGLGPNTATPAAVITIQPVSTPTFLEVFPEADAGLFLNFDGSHWPPIAGTAGRWARMYQQGWPTNSGGQDPAARCLSGNHEAQCFEDSGVSVLPGGGLKLTATRGAWNRHGMPWTSGAVTLNPDIGFLYGYIEATIEHDGEGGMWPAFWMLPCDHQYAPGWEDDIVEGVGKTWDNKTSVLATRAGIAEFGDSGVWNDALPGVPNRYGMLKSAAWTQFFLNGAPRGPAYPTPPGSRRPKYVLLNLAVGGSGSWPGEPAASLTTASMRVKRVASYNEGSWGAYPLPRIA